MNVNRPLPPIGGRIIKSAIAVALCMGVYWIRSLLPVGNGIPFYGALAALWCLQPYTDATRHNAGQRTAGTLIGAAYGLAFLLVLHLFAVSVPMVVYLTASAVIIPVIYTAVITENRNAAFFSCVVFLSIALTHSFDENPYLFVWNRVLDTMIGIGIGMGVNVFRLPVKHDDRTLYVSGIDSVLISDSPSAVQYSKVELNRLIAAGVRFTISTVRTPAEVMTLMQGVNLQLPLIVMDGAALYDCKEKQFLEAAFLPVHVSHQAEQIIAGSGLHCFVNVLFDTTLLIFYGEFRNPAEEALFASHRQSPYRNYVRAAWRNESHREQILYLTVLAEQEKIAALEQRLHASLGEQIRVAVLASEYDGYAYLKVFSPQASKHEMLKKLKALTGAGEVVTFGSIKGEYDVYIGDGGGNATIKKLKKLHRSGVWH